MDIRPQRIYGFGPFQLDKKAQLLTRDGAPVTLSPRMFDLLSVLVENAGHMVLKEDLMTAVWKDCAVEEGNLAVSVFKLRRLLGRSNNNRSYIETIPRRGYRFAADDREGNQNGNQDVIDGARYSGLYGEEKSSIAVLPFKFIGPVGDEFMGLGIADALITKLSTLTSIAVRPTSSVSRFNGTQDPVGAGRELNVESVLDGSVQKRGRRVRVTTQLVNVSDGSILWAAKFDEKFSGIFAMEDSVSEQVANALKPTLTRNERKLLAKRHTESPEAHEAYLRGRYFFAKRTKDGLDKGIECFNRAIEIDAKYALAYAGLADCYLLRRAYFTQFKDFIHETEPAVLKAIELDGDLAEAHASLGYLRTFQWLWCEAEEEFRVALKLNHGYATAHNWYAVYLAIVGRLDEAMLENQTALQLDPLSTVLRSTRGKLLYFARRYDQAEDQLLKVLEWDPAYGVARYCLSLVYEAKGLYDKATITLAQAIKFFGGDPEMRAGQARLAALSGRKREARLAIEALNRSSKRRYVDSVYIALIHAALGETENAFACLETGFMQRSLDLALVGVDPRLDGLRSDPRFVDLLRRVGLPDATNRRMLEAAPVGRP